MKLLRNAAFTLAVIVLAGCGSNYDSSNYDFNQVTQAQYQTTPMQCSCVNPPPSSKPVENVVTKAKSTKKVTKTSSLVKTSVPITQSTSKPQAAQQDLAKIIYDKTVAKIHSIQTFKTSIRHFAKGNIYKKQPIAESKLGRSTNYVVFQRPRKMFLKIVDSVDSPSLQNTRLVFDGSPNVRIKVPGLLGLFTFTFPVDKPELSNYRGYNLYDIDTISLETRLDNKDAKVKLLGLSELFDEPVYMIEVTNIKFLDNKITKEIIGVRKSDYMITLEEMYEGEELVFQNKFENYKYNIPLTNDDFKI